MLARGPVTVGLVPMRTNDDDQARRRSMEAPKLQSDDTGTCPWRPGATRSAFSHASILSLLSLREDWAAASARLRRARRRQDINHCNPRHQRAAGLACFRAVRRRRGCSTTTQRYRIVDALLEGQIRAWPIPDQASIPIRRCDASAVGVAVSIVNPRCPRHREFDPGEPRRVIDAEMVVGGELIQPIGPVNRRDIPGKA